MTFACRARPSLRNTPHPPQLGILPLSSTMDQNRSPIPTSTDAKSVLTGMNNSHTPSTATKRPRKRPSKRFLWQEDLHLRFVAAIFDLGLKNASPKALLPLVKTSDPDSGLTTEHLKSHLQKYRINYDRSRREFKELCRREIKRSRKRQRRHGRHQLSTSSAFLFQNKLQDATDPEGDENASSSASIIKEGERQQVTPLTRSGESVVVVDYVSPDQPASVAPAMPELTDAQWRTFNMLMSTSPPDMTGLSIQVPQDGLFLQPRVQEELRVQMHQAMQAQMNLHRQMLTRKVELSHDLRQRSGVGNWEGSSGNYNYYAQEPPFQHAWAGTQRQLASHQLQQMRQYDSQPPTALPVESSGDPQTLPSSSLPSIIATQPDELVDVKSDAAGEDLSQLDPFNVGLESDDLFDFLKA
uniref:HTH myb-type domain-containing protein n=1 Tax=Phytophthora ramorum TaxID=164328 RepID=H3GUV4_PHYRM